MTSSKLCTVERLIRSSSPGDFLLERDEIFLKASPFEPENSIPLAVVFGSRLFSDERTSCLVVALLIAEVYNDAVKTHKPGIV